jgi:hypothetical protein
MLLVTIDKFDFNPISLANINKVKSYRFVEDHTLQHVLAKPSDLFLEEPIERNHFGNLFTKELVETNHCNDMFTKEPFEMVQFSNLSIKEPIELYTRDMIANNLVEKGPIVACPTKNQLKKVLMTCWKRN